MGGFPMGLSFGDPPLSFLVDSPWLVLTAWWFLKAHGAADSKHLE